MKFSAHRTLMVLCVCGLVLPVVVAAPPTKDPFTKSQREYWVFQDVVRPELPSSSSQSAHPIDAFVAQRLADKGIALSPRAGKVTLIRRASFDLIGLPPTPAETKAFLEDDSPDSFAKVVDRLLESPHYGERWGRHWLDLARYAESEGFKADETRPNAWRYRDYVINAFNDDKPYDSFVQEQIAGDELWPDDPWARIATTFNRNYPDETNAANLWLRRQEILQDMTDTVGAVFMGLTYGCAKCHDHKFDPILQADYYRLQAFFANSKANDEVAIWRDEQIADHKEKLAVWEETTLETREQIEAMLGPKRKQVLDEQFARYPQGIQEILLKPAEARTAFERQMQQKYAWQMEYMTNEKALAGKLQDEEKERYETLAAERDKFAHLHPGEIPIGTGIYDLGTEAPPTHILTVANYDKPTKEVQPGFPSILDPEPAKYAPPDGLSSTGRRAALAKWLTDPGNPLTPRVMVNRIWHHHFGKGIVTTPSDFGLMGERPTHPELLDWLSGEFVSGGWSIKNMHRLIMTSGAYQQSSAFREAADKADPFNRLLWRYPSQRLEAEVIRDSALRVSGLLNPAVGGPSVFPPLPRGMAEPRGGWQVSEAAAGPQRRSVYIFVRRNARYPMLEAFDMPDTHETCARRDTTMTAPQALIHLNSNQTVEWARAFAGRLIETAGPGRSEQLDLAYEIAYSRPADSAEKDAGLAFLDTQAGVIAKRHAAGEKLALPTMMPPELEPAQGAALVDLCHSILNSNEFVFRY